VIAFGAWAIGGWQWGGADEERSIRAIHAALDAGVNLIDTAPVYGFGVSEEVIGRALRGRQRDQVIIATKCGLVWEGDRGEPAFRTDGKIITPDGHMQVWRYLGPESVRRELEASLKRLQTDYIDLYQTHWQEATTPIEDTMAELLRLKDEGKIRAIGVSNATVEQIARYQKVGPVDCDQERYSMLDRKLEADQLPYLRQHDIALLAYSPLAHGLLTGRVTPDRTFPPTDMRAHSPRFSVENRQRVASLLAAIEPLAQARGITLSQLVLAWTFHQPGVTHLLVGARDEDQARANAAAGEITLTAEELAQIDAAVDQYRDLVVR